MTDAVADQSFDRPTVSVIIPAYNAAATLEPCIRSVLAQDYPSSLVEFIVVDNGSTDGTNAILSRYKDQVIALTEPRRGAAAARNLGVRQASSEFVAFTDADCETAPSWLRSLIETATEDRGAAFIGGPVKAHDAAHPIELFGERLFDHQAALERQRFPYAITGNVLIRRDFLLRIGLFDARLLRGHDTELSYRALFEHQARFAYSPKAVIYHRNPRHLLALFREGGKHGRGSANVLACHGDKINATAFGRAFQGRRYRQICTGLVNWARLLFRSDEMARQERGDYLYDAVFNIGKQLGTIVQASRNALFRR
jgi:glycosyltransferase involved in cell wall biosynthesis